MKIEERPDRLVVRDNPAPFWAFYALFPLTGCLALYLSSVTIEDMVARTIAAGIGLSHIAGGAFMLWKEPGSVVEVDRLAGRLRVTRWGLFGRKVEDRPSDAVTGAEVEVGEHSEGGAIYRPTLVLHSGERAPVSMFWYQQEAPSSQVVARLNTYLSTICTSTKHEQP